MKKTAKPTSLPGVRDWVPDLHLWKVVIRGRRYWIPKEELVRFIFDLDDEEADRQIQLFPTETVHESALKPTAAPPRR